MGKEEKSGGGFLQVRGGGGGATAQRSRRRSGVCVSKRRTRGSSTAACMITAMVDVLMKNGCYSNPCTVVPDIPADYMQVLVGGNLRCCRVQDASPKKDRIERAAFI